MMTKRQTWLTISLILILFSILTVGSFAAIFRGEEFYPGRIHGDYSDEVFNYGKYLKAIGATDGQRYLYAEAKGLIVQEYHFELDGNKWQLKSYIMEGNQCATVSSSIIVDCGDVIYGTTSENRGKVVSDIYTDSPFCMDGAVFDVFHLATSDSELKDSLQVGLDEDPCPFKGLGIAHYEKDPKTGDVQWHDDQGDRTIYDNGSDYLHY